MHVPGLLRVWSSPQPTGTVPGWQFDAVDSPHTALAHSPVNPPWDVKYVLGLWSKQSSQVPWLAPPQPFR
jgi:hypothetical protein